MAAVDKHLSVTIIINDIYPVYELQVYLALTKDDNVPNGWQRRNQKISSDSDI